MDGLIFWGKSLIDLRIVPAFRWKIKNKGFALNNIQLTKVKEWFSENGAFRNLNDILANSAGRGWFDEILVFPLFPQKMFRVRQSLPYRNILLFLKQR